MDRDLSLAHFGNQGVERKNFMIKEKFRFRSNFDEEKWFRIIKGEKIRRCVLPYIKPTRFLFVSHEKSTHRIPDDSITVCSVCFSEKNTSCNFCEEDLTHWLLESARTKSIVPELKSAIEDDPAYSIRASDLEMDMSEDY